MTHTIDGGGYQTQFEVSQSANQALLPSLREKITDAPQPSKQAPIHGVVVGRVENNVDEEGSAGSSCRFPTSPTSISALGLALPRRWPATRGAGNERGI